MAVLAELANTFLSIISSSVLYFGVLSCRHSCFWTDQIMLSLHVHVMLYMSSPIEPSWCNSVQFYQLTLDFDNLGFVGIVGFCFLCSEFNFEITWLDRRSIVLDPKSWCFFPPFHYSCSKTLQIKLVIISVCKITVTRRFYHKWSCEQYILHHDISMQSKRIIRWFRTNTSFMIIGWDHKWHNNLEPPNNFL